MTHAHRRSPSAIGIFLIAAALPCVGADSRWSISLDAGDPELIGMRLERHSGKGSYVGLQPGLLVTVPAHLASTNDLWTFTPGVFYGMTAASRGPLSLTAELDLCHPMSFNRNGRSGGVVLTPQAGLSMNTDRFIVRVLGGAGIVVLPTIGWDSEAQIAPAFLLEVGSYIGRPRPKPRDQRFSDDDGAWSWPGEADGSAAKKLAPQQPWRQAEKFQAFPDRRQCVAIDPAVTIAMKIGSDSGQQRADAPLFTVIRNTVSVTYSCRLGRRNVIGINPQVALSRHSNKVGCCGIYDYYLTRAFYGWHAFGSAGYVPTVITHTGPDADGDDATIADVVYGFGARAGIGYRRSFRRGFTLDATVGILYVKTLSDPSPSFLEDLDTGFPFDDHRIEHVASPAAFVSLSAGWAF